MERILFLKPYFASYNLPLLASHRPVMTCCEQRQRLQPAPELHASPPVVSGEKTGGFVPRLNFILVFFHCLDCYSVFFFFLSLSRYVGQRCKSRSSSQRGRGTSARDSRFFTAWKWRVLRIVGLICISDEGRVKGRWE